MAVIALAICLPQIEQVCIYFLLSRTFSRSIDAIYLSMEAINHATH